MPDDKRFIFDQVTLVNFVSLHLATTGIKLLSLIIDFLVKLGKHSQRKFYAAFSSVKF